MNKHTPTFDESKSLFSEDFWFESEKLRATLDQLEHFTRFGDLLILLIGEPLSGKSSILEKMQARVTDSDLCVIKSHPLLSIQEILRRMRSSFNLVLTPDQAEQSVEQMHDYLAASIPEKNHRLVVIDDAEQLGKETLLELLKLVDIQRQRGESLVHFILAGEEPLLKSLRAIKRKKFPRAAYHRLKVHPISAQEITQLVLDANVPPDVINLTEEKCQKIYQFSNGNIGKIKHSLENLAQGIEINEPTKKKNRLSKKQQEKKRSELEQKIDTLYGDLDDDNTWLMPVVIVLGIIAFGAYWYLQYQPKEPATKKQSTQSIVKSIKPPVDKVKLERRLALAERNRSVDAESVDHSVLTNAADTNASDIKSGNISLHDDAEKPQQEGAEIAYNEDVADITSQAQPANTDSQENSQEISQEDILEPIEPLQNHEVPAEEDESQFSVEKESNTKISAQDENEKRTVSTPTDNISAIDSEDKNNVSKESTLSNSDNVLKYRNKQTGQAEQILAWPKGHYTIQLLVVSEQRYFERFKAQYGSIDYYWFNSTRNNKNVMFVISGHYETKELALNEAKKLVNKHPKLSTWVKPVDLIHQDILAFKKK
jgi:septal ring-binding cell division protein DamX